MGSLNFATTVSHSVFASKASQNFCRHVVIKYFNRPQTSCLLSHCVLEGADLHRLLVLKRVFKVHKYAWRNIFVRSRL